MHAGEDFREFLGVGLGDGSYGALIFGRGILYEVETVLTTLFVKGVSGAGVFQFYGGADISGTKVCRRES